MKSALRIFRVFLVAFFICVSIGCGKYARPLTPESVSPAAVNNLQVQGTLEGVNFSWNSPQTDRRGKELKDLSGYTVERKTLVNAADAVDSSVEFEELTTLEDVSIPTLLKEKERLRADEKPSHRAKIDGTLREFHYTDDSVTPGTQYLYRVVPQSYYGDGDVVQFVRVLFRGDASETTIFKGDDLDTGLDDSVFTSAPEEQ